MTIVLFRWLLHPLQRIKRSIRRRSHHVSSRGRSNAQRPSTCRSLRSRNGAINRRCRSHLHSGCDQQFALNRGSRSRPFKSWFRGTRSPRSVNRWRAGAEAGRICRSLCSDIGAIRGRCRPHLNSRGDEWLALEHRTGCSWFRSQQTPKPRATVCSRTDPGNWTGRRHVPHWPTSESLSSPGLVSNRLVCQTCSSRGCRMRSYQGWACSAVGGHRCPILPAN